MSISKNVSEKISRTRKIKIIIIVLAVVLGVISALTAVAYVNLQDKQADQKQKNTDTISTPTQPNGKKLVTIEGELTCLPHKNPEQPHTMECALGLKTPSGVHYALKDETPNYSLLSKAETGVLVQVSGSLEEIPSDKYASNGIITLTALEAKQ